MCGLFGYADYGGTLTPDEKQALYARLAAASEIRGEHAGGVAWPGSGQEVRIAKAPGPITNALFETPRQAEILMGHCRYSAFQNQEDNRNNHPFAGETGDGVTYALAHNGILADLADFRKAYGLHRPDIATDSYAAVQFLNREESLNVAAFRRLGDALRGSFSFTVLDGHRNLFFLRGDVPIFLVHFVKRQLYVYASTRDLLEKAICETPLGLEYALSNLESSGNAVRWIALSKGDILRIDRSGNPERAGFRFDETRTIRHNWYRHRIENNAAAIEQLRYLNND